MRPVPAALGEGEVLNEGDERDENISNDEEIVKQVERKLTDALTTIKLVGNLPAWAEILVNEVLKPKVDWRRLIRSLLTKGLGKKVKRTWTRPSRKYPLFPGKETLKTNHIVALIDTSGSIGEKELKQFLGEVYGIVREHAEVIVIPWDARAYDPIPIKRPSDIKNIKLRGGGGTKIRPALKLLNSKYSNADMVVILSDWCIGDLNEPKTVELLKKYAGKIVAVTTYAEPPKYLPVRAKIEF